MDPVLGDRYTSVVRPCLRPLLALEDTDSLRFLDRLDWTSETLVGVMGRAFKAAAAAADERDVGAGSRRIKAEAAAVAAFGLAVSFVKGCAKAMVSTTIHSTWNGDTQRRKGQVAEFQSWGAHKEAGAMTVPERSHDRSPSRKLYPSPPAACRHHWQLPRPKVGVASCSADDDVLSNDLNVPEQERDSSSSCQT